ncbi:MAG TPA: hypothetical protein PKW56_05140 [Clostridiales bacterium]|nr:hypothetical protein [Clostridiales bacterium]
MIIYACIARPSKIITEAMEKTAPAVFSRYATVMIFSMLLNLYTSV